MDRKKQNLDVYSQNASSFAEKFDRIGPRAAEVKEVFSLIPKENPAVLELGCANGRDAAEILKYTNNYLGIDFSPALIELAKKANSKGNFQVADLEDFEFPKDLDAVFAFASLIHTPKEVQAAVFKKIQEALKSRGIFFFSAKTYPQPEVVQTDEFGTRVYYSYSADDVKELSEGVFDITKLESMDFQGQEWISAILQKP